ncbi:MAG: substrate-binding domain-containing protein [Verrucomicrobiota bacterium]
MKTPQFFVCLLVFLSLTLSGKARDVQVAGSDYIPEALIDALREFASKEGDELEVDLGGSLLAFRQFYEGEADIILVAMPFQRPEDLEFPVFPFGFQIGAVVVNADNPITSMTQQQLGGVFGALNENAIARWSELGLTGTWQNRNIAAAYANSGKSPILDLFSNRFLQGDPIRSGIQEFSSDIRLESFVSNDDATIGIVDSLPLSSDLKTIRIQTSDGGVSFGPTLENINYGDYPLSLEYFVCVPMSQYRFLAPYIEFLLSDEVAEILQRERFFPLLRSRRLQLIEELPTS